MAESDIDIIVKGKDEISGVLDKAGSALGALSETASRSTGAVSGLFGAMAGPALAATEILGGALIGVGVAAFDMALDVDAGQRHIQASLDLTADAAQALGPEVDELFKSRLVDGAEEAAQAIAEVRHQFKGLADEELAETAEKGLLISETFGDDYAQVLNTAAGMSKHFGETVEESLDRITKGYQNGLNASGDMLATLSEYTPILVDMGASADEAFAIFTTGIQSGVLGVDKIADAMKEFSIRIKDGSDTTRDGLNKLFTEVGTGIPEVDALHATYVALEQKLDSTTSAVAANAAALKNAEGAYAGSQDTVNELTDALSEARRELSGLARPNLVGMEEFDDAIFDTEHQIKRVRLQMTGLEKDTPEFEAARAHLEMLNEQLESLTLSRDLTFDKQLREIEKAAQDSSGSAVTFAEAMQQVADKKEEIGGLETALTDATNELSTNAEAVDILKVKQAELNVVLTETELALENSTSAADWLLQGIADGSIKGLDALKLVQGGLLEVNDILLQNEIGVAVFGTPWEDLGAKAILAIDTTVDALEGYEGAADRLSVKTDDIASDFTEMQREIMSALQPVGTELLALAQEYMPEMREAASWLAEVVRDELPGAIEWLKGVLQNDLPTAIEWSTTKFHDFQRGVALVKDILDKELPPAIEWSKARFADFQRGVGFVVDIFEDASRGARYLKDQVVWLWDKFTSLDDVVPDILRNGLNAAGGLLGQIPGMDFLGDLFAPGGGVSPGGGGGGGWDGSGGGGSSVSVGEINVNGAQDPQATAQAVREELIRVGRMNAGNSDLFGDYA